MYNEGQDPRLPPPLYWAVSDVGPATFIVRVGLVSPSAHPWNAYTSTAPGMATVWIPTFTRLENGVVSVWPSKVNFMPG